MASFDPLDEKVSTRKQAAWVALEDIKARTAKYKLTFSDQAQELADTVYDLAANAYFRSRVFRPDYQKTFIRIKVQKPVKADKCSRAARRMEEFCLAHNVEIKSAKAHIYFRVKA